MYPDFKENPEKHDLPQKDMTLWPRPQALFFSLVATHVKAAVRSQREKEGLGMRLEDKHVDSIIL